MTVYFLLPVIDLLPKQQFFIRTNTKKWGEEDARVQDFSEIYLLERNEKRSIAALENCVQKGMQNNSICLHKQNFDSAVSVLDWIKGGKPQNPDRIAVGFEPGTIVWARFDNRWWPARVSAILLVSFRFLEGVCTLKS